MTGVLCDWTMSPVEPALMDVLNAEFGIATGVLPCTTDAVVIAPLERRLIEIRHQPSSPQVGEVRTLRMSADGASGGWLPGSKEVSSSNSKTPAGKGHETNTHFGLSHLSITQQ